jgi:hypothetical protein
VVSNVAPSRRPPVRVVSLEGGPGALGQGALSAGCTWPGVHLAQGAPGLGFTWPEQLVCEEQLSRDGFPISGRDRAGLD